MPQQYLEQTMTTLKFNKSLLLSITLTALLSACGQEEPQENAQPLRPVRTITVTAADTNNIHEFPAVVDAARKADLSFKVSGELVAFNVNQGEEIQAGQVIAKLNDRDIKIQLQEAQSSFNKAKADYQRAQELIRASSISQADFDQIKAQYHGAYAKLASAENNLEYTELKASFSGVIAKKYTENYQEISAKSPIVALHDLSQVLLKIDVPESIMIRVQRRVGPPTLTATFDAIAGVEFPLTFKEVTTQADDITKTYQVTLVMQAPKDHTILPGMTAHVTAKRLLAHQGTEPLFYLPANTVLKDSQGNYVYTVHQQEQGIGKITRTTVTVGDITPLGIEVFAGISAGDVVLSAGMSKVTNGMLVKY